MSSPKTATVFVATILSCVAVAGCASTKSAGVPVANLPGEVQVEALQRQQYEVGKVTEGRDCASFVWLFPLPIWWMTSDELGTDLWAFKFTETVARKGAVYRALENAASADFLTAPRAKIEYASVGPWYSSTCYEVKARAARLKEDHELPGESFEVDVKLRKGQAQPSVP